MAQIDSPKSVTFIWNYPNWGGAQIAFLSIVRNAPPGWTFKIVLPRDSNPEIIRFFEPFGVDVAYLDRSYAPGAAASLSDKLMRQWQRIRSEAEVYMFSRRHLARGSVIHISTAPWQSWILLLLLSLRFAVTATVHNSLPTENPALREAIWRWRLDFLMRRRNFQLFAANLDAVNGLRRFVNERFWDKITLTRDSINPTEIAAVLEKPFDRDELLSQHNIPTDRFIVLCVGQFIDRKGRWVFLEAAKRALKIDQGLFFVWVGPDAPKEAELKRISEYELDGSFKFVVSSSLGTKREDILTFFRVADIFVLASFVEGLPISIIEAMSLGIPTISTNINGIPEAVIDMETGLLVEPGDERSLADAILKIRSDDSLRRSISTSCRDFAIKKFDERVSTTIVFDRYMRAIG